jgi:acetylornithine deacetylase/succinyl-diaminopimelate desuccinylase-like protein
VFGRIASLAPALLLVASACGSVIEVDGERAMARVRHQVDAGPRVPGTPGHAAIQDWIARELERQGAEVELQAFVDSSLGRALTLTNVIGRFGPPGVPRVILMAHWDTRAVADQDPIPERRRDPVPGANDGASGVAVLLEVGDLMHETAPRVGVDLVFVDGEDQGDPTKNQEFCLGSRYYAAQLPRGYAKAAFVFDMVGDRDLAIHPEVMSARRAANLARLVLDAAKATGARHFHETPRFSVFDDHIRLLDAGIPAVDVIDFEYSAWHTSRDLPDQVSAASLAEVARVAAWLVYRSPLARTGAR